MFLKKSFFFIVILGNILPVAPVFRRCLSRRQRRWFLRTSGSHSFSPLQRQYSNQAPIKRTPNLTGSNFHKCPPRFRDQVGDPNSYQLWSLIVSAPHTHTTQQSLTLSKGLMPSSHRVHGTPGSVKWRAATTARTPSVSDRFSGASTFFTLNISVPWESCTWCIFSTSLRGPNLPSVWKFRQSSFISPSPASQYQKAFISGSSLFARL